jgi:ABC-2 type transport system ATP-binding protein
MTVTTARRAVVVEAYADYAVEAYNLRKVYRTRRGRHPAVDGLDLRVPLGGVHGFLGPNGSGKTTTIRMLLGLVAADSGYIRVFDHEVPLQLAEVIDQVGAIVEQPKFFPTFTARKNLALLARGIGAPRGRVDAVLEEVGLADRARDKFRTYSLGMKQRLAIAAGLLQPRDLIILDEPTNGLDPQGTREVRALIRQIAADGITVFVSSHLLAEVEQICTHVGVMRTGRLVFQGELAELRRTGAARVTVQTADPEAAAKVLAGLGLTGVSLTNASGVAHGGGDTGDSSTGDSSPGEASAVLGDASPEQICAELVQAGIGVRGFAVTSPSLEDLFVGLTGEGFDVSG